VSSEVSACVSVRALYPARDLELGEFDYAQCLLRAAEGTDWLYFVLLLCSQLFSQLCGRLHLPWCLSEAWLRAERHAVLARSTLRAQKAPPCAATQRAWR